MESQKSSSFIGWESYAGNLLRIPGLRHFPQQSDRIRSWCLQPREPSLLLRSSFHLRLRTRFRFSVRMSWFKRRYRPGDIEFCLGCTPFTDWRNSGCWIMQPDFKRFISLPAIQICGVELMAWLPLWNLTSNWIRMKKTFFFSSVADAATVSKVLYRKVTVFFSYTKGWNLAVSAGPVQRKKHWRSHRNNIRHWCRDWRSSPDIRSGKYIPGISCKTLCKTEKIKKIFAFTVLSGSKVIHSRAFLHSFNPGVLTDRKLSCG